MLSRLHRTESFRLTAIFAGIVVVAMIILMVPVYAIMQKAFRTELLTAVDHDIAAIQTGYRSEGLSEAQEIIRQQLANSNNDQFFLIERLPQMKLTGNLPAMPAKLGAFDFPVPASLLRRHHGGDHWVIGKGQLLAPDLYLYAGRDSFVANEAREDVLRTFVWVLLATLFVALGGGVLVSRGVLGRMDAITRTCRAIMAGRLSDRIPERGTRGEFDLLVRTINEMLDRISGLMENVQQISSDIAHDLRTPLTRLRNRLELAQSEASTVDAYRQAVSRAIAESETILETFSALLRIGQIESGMAGTPSERVDLSALMTDLGEIYRPAAEDRGFILMTAITPDLFIMGDKFLLSQVFANLIENAMTHTPSGATITVRLVSEPDGIVAGVSDNGPGIPVEERERVLRRFYRREQSRSTPGNGLGLSLVAAIAKYHGAVLVVGDNSPGLEVSLRFRRAHSSEHLE